VFDGLRAIWRGLRNVQLAGYSYIWANVAFVALSLPIFTFPAALSALFRVSHVAHTEPSSADLSLFWDTFRTNLVKAMPWGLLNLLFAVVNFANLQSYANASEPIIVALRATWILAGFIWLAMILYTWPIYYEMRSPTIAGATRNALIMVFQNPVFTLVMLSAVLMLSFMSTILMAAWLLLTFGAIASLANAAVLDRLSIIRNST
jgi:uncharacterized membrane protein YesL